VNNFVKGFLYLLPAALASLGVIIFTMNDPTTLIIFKVIAEVFCGILAVTLLFFSVLLIVWGLRNAFMHIFKINFNISNNKK